MVGPAGLKPHWFRGWTSLRGSLALELRISLSLGSATRTRRLSAANFFFASGRRGRVPAVAAIAPAAGGATSYGVASAPMGLRATSDGS
jgi:hypothetical protein